MVGSGALRCAGLACAALLVAPGVAQAAWNQPVGGASPINRQANRPSLDTSLTEIGGVPYVAWRESGPGINFEIRVRRLNAAGTGWAEVAGRATSGSPINHGGGGNPFNPRVVG